MGDARDTVRLLDWKSERKTNHLRDVCENNIQTFGSYLINILITSTKNERIHQFQELRVDNLTLKRYFKKRFW